MTQGCAYEETTIEDSDGHLIFKSMGDIARATASFAEDPKNPKALNVLNAYRRFRLDCLSTSQSLLVQAGLPQNVLISARLKRLRSIRRKLLRSKPSKKLGTVSQMDDIIGFRVICQSCVEAEVLGERLHDELGARIKNYSDRAHPAKLGYRAIHAIVRFDQPFRDNTVTSRLEVQVRTWYQHQWACWCESHGEHAKEGFRNEQARDESTYRLIHKLQDQSAEIARWEQQNYDRIQRHLPAISDPYGIALAWFDEQKNYGFDNFGQNHSEAVVGLNYLESLIGLDPLLLVGIGEEATENSKLKRLLMKTHPKFMSTDSLDPRYWMPE